MTKTTFKFDIVENVVTTMYRYRQGDWRLENLNLNEAAVYDALTTNVTVTERFPTFMQVKTYLLQGDSYVLQSERFTDLAGMPLPSGHKNGGFKDSNHDGFDDDDLDHDGLKDDYLTALPGSNATLSGRAGDDILSGSSADDYLDGGIGDDDVSGGSGSDRLVGGTGNDYLSGDEGDDRLSGDDGDDHILGGSGNDTLKAGKGNDYLDADSGNNTLDGGSGNDVFVAGLGSGADRYTGGSGIDTITYLGAQGGVIINLAKGYAVAKDDGDAAAIGQDKLRAIEYANASDYDDIVIGNSAANALDGGNGNDLIIGGGQADLLIGGNGADTFRFLKASEIGLDEHDVIIDFSSIDGDLIDLSAIDAKKGFEKNASFSFISDSTAVSAVTANGAVWFKDGVLYASTDNDVAAELQLELAGVLTLSEANIVL